MQYKNYKYCYISIFYLYLYYTKILVQFIDYHRCTETFTDNHKCLYLNLETEMISFPPYMLLGMRAIIFLIFYNYLLQTVQNLLSSFIIFSLQVSLLGSCGVFWREKQPQNLNPSIKVHRQKKLINIFLSKFCFSLNFREFNAQVQVPYFKQSR